MTHHELELFADYYQFYVQDEEANGDLSDAWTEGAVTRLLAVASGVVGVGTVRNMDVPVSIAILDGEPSLDVEAFDHIVECSLSVKSGRIVAAGCTDYFPEAMRITAAPGMYRVRISYAGLDSPSADGVDGNDRYRLELWQAPEIAPVVLKQRASQLLANAD